MPSVETPSPLAVAALAVVLHGTTPAGVVARFETLGARIDEATAAARLEELDVLGLVRRIHGSAGDGELYRLTPLGERVLKASFAVGEPVELLAEIEQMRTDLLSTIAHELRTPLTAVRTSVGLLLDPGVDPTAEERRTLLETIERNATRMQRIVGDILDISRFRGGRVHLQLRRFDAADLAASAIASVAPLAESRHQPITLAAPPEPVAVFGDFRRLEQALVNLLSNAHKFSPDGAQIRVAVGSDGDDVWWSVGDEGDGIHEEDKPKLFERFFVAGRDRRNAGAGVGLGLPISLLIVQAHGGAIDVDSERGRGSTFTISVPADGPAEAATE